MAFVNPRDLALARRLELFQKIKAYFGNRYNRDLGKVYALRKLARRVFRGANSPVCPAFAPQSANKNVRPTNRDA
ncbi:MAG: hypothetical protein L0Y72_20775 [Gemmataceae bacterium]|nr:hypothetical protein [Gemmataceae bacterium]